MVQCFEKETINVAPERKTQQQVGNHDSKSRNIPTLTSI